jgi:hypothetical protein
MMFGYGFSVGFLNLFIAIIFSAPKYLVMLIYISLTPATLTINTIFSVIIEFMDYANEQSKKINKAYDAIKKSRQ